MLVYWSQPQFWKLELLYMDSPPLPILMKDCQGGWVGVFPETRTCTNPFIIWNYWGEGVEMKILLSQYCNLKFDKIGYKEGVSLTPPPPPPFPILCMQPPGETPTYNWQGCSSKFSKETPKSYHIGCGSSQFYCLKVTLEIFNHRNNTQTRKIENNRQLKGQQVLL